MEATLEERYKFAIECYDLNKIGGAINPVFTFLTSTQAGAVKVLERAMKAGLNKVEVIDIDNIERPYDLKGRSPSFEDALEEVITL